MLKLLTPRVVGTLIGRYYKVQGKVQRRPHMFHELTQTLVC